MKSNDIRQSFLDFFEAKKHHLAKSDGLVPSSDPTLLFTSAGMVQFKNMFQGKTKLTYTRAVSCQKCFRTNDIERVGHTARHHTFFEMLGNFSFGDYFKKDAIHWAWEYLTKTVKLPPEKLWVTVYQDDDEAAEIWQSIVKPDRIVRLGKESNFWEMGETGPCGPCSEILYDQGEKTGCGKPECKVGCDCDRYLEVWNLVFTQFDRNKAGHLTPLPQKNIDTGMGLERLAAVVQEVSSNFDTDLFRPIILKASDLAGVEYGREEKIDRYLKVIADHIRGITFLCSEGILPSNEGRGYVLRRLIRRAHRYGKLLNIKDTFLHLLAGVVIDSMKSHYPELAEAKEHTYNIIINEEKKFQQTLEQGLTILEEIIADLKNTKNTMISGKIVFQLYDTYGFPVDLTKEITAEQGFQIDEQGFEAEMEQQREKARSAWKGSGAEDLSFYSLLHKDTGDTIFTGYDEIKTTSRILALIADKKQVAEASSGTLVQVILEQTPCYGETGGQIGDTGKITKPDGEIIITHTARPIPGLIVHEGKITSGIFAKNDTVDVVVDEERRQNIARNHTATHLLQAALRKTLGSHIAQAGSLVEPERLRFDFTHNQSLEAKELSALEDMVNADIRANLPVMVTETSQEEARKKGAMALFGEKYGEKVRLVEVSGASMELCGGTHCHTSGEIGLFKIVSESSIAQGVRRIEAVTGQEAISLLHQQDQLINDLEQILKTNAGELTSRVNKLLEQVKTLQKEIQQQKSKTVSHNSNDLISDVKQINGIALLAKAFPDADAEDLRKIGDQLKNSLKSGVFILGGLKNGKIALICMVTDDLIAKGLHAAKIIKEVATVVGGSGGGRADLAQAGGKEPDKLDKAISKSLDIISKIKYSS
ncbi:MAG: alanine--tRNA ligase [bacterium]|nr:alanine--tRNA ligase [bacterium]MDD5353918.1 alanine--tRNA ligase [bacterium]MDD5755771.1 alanine--tRNA ligase [bacterium]